MCYFAQRWALNYNKAPIRKKREKKKNILGFFSCMWSVRSTGLLTTYRGSRETGSGPIFSKRGQPKTCWPIVDMVLVLTVNFLVLSTIIDEYESTVLENHARNINRHHRWSIGRFSFFGLKHDKKAKRYASFDDEIEMIGWSNHILPPIITI